MRVIAGPNGSGKTTLYAHIRTVETLNWGFVQNPDLIERDLRHAGVLDFTKWGIETTTKEVRAGLARREGVETKGVVVRGNVLHVPMSGMQGYFAAALCEFMRNKWIAEKVSFTFETVMSHASKLDLLDQAKSLGYRTYLYFVCTSSSCINEQRVKSRVQDGGVVWKAKRVPKWFKKSDLA